MLIKYTALAALATLCLADFDNQPPIPGKQPVYTMGTPKQGIEILVIYDLICQDSKEHHPEFKRFLDMNWTALGGPNTTVREQVQIRYSFLPLTFHHAVWVPHKLIPFLLDECDFTDNCNIEEYIDFTFAHMDEILNAYSTSYNEVVGMWASKVAMEYGYPV